MSGAYYNDHDPGVCAWLTELIKRGHLPDGEVDCRSILDVRPDDLRGFRSCHFFAGIGGWAYALRLAGWPDDRPVWTGSPPCQPFSAAGKGLSRDDPRHLAPHFARLVGACRPDLLFGEQVASADVFGPSPKGNRPGFEGSPPWAWLDDLSDRLEAARYAFGASDIPSAGVGAPHIRQRTFFGAIRLDRLDDPAGARHLGQIGGSEGDPRDEARLRLLGARGRVGGLADADDAGSQGRGEPGRERADERPARAGSMAGGLADADNPEWRPDATGRHDGSGSNAGRSQGPSDAEGRGDIGRPGPTNGFWRSADWLYCRDEFWRPVEPGTFPLAHGLSARVGRLRGYGNAINPWAAAEFVRAFCEAAEVEI